MRELAQSDAAVGLPSGTVTFLLSDIEGSTRLWETEPEAMAQVVPRHYELLAAAVERHRGVRPIEQGEGDSTVTAFARASDALEAAIDAQRALLGEAWPGAIELKVRMALHTAEAQLRDAGNYQGVALSRCARLRAIANGAQILLSQTTYDIVVDGLRDGLGLVDLGVHRLRDLGRSERVFGVSHPDLPPAGALRPVDARPNNLPVALTSFIGREHELGEVAAVLCQTRLLTLTGAGGCGKTRLALNASAEALERFGDGVWWVELASLSGLDVVSRALAQVLGVRPLPGADDLDAAVFYLESRDALVVLDNCEHVLDQAADAAQAILTRCPHVTVLATSREPLRVAGESDWRVPSLSLPAEDEPASGALAQSDALELFIDRARKVRPNFQLTDAAVGLVAEICRGLDGIPLAIELAAARVRMLSLEQIAAGLSDRFRLLTGGARSALPRQQTLRASVEWSHELLSADERVLFRRLAVFAGGFTLEAAEQVCHDEGLAAEQVLDLLASVVEKSLVQTDEDAHCVRYRLLETVRQYALEQLSGAGELEAVRNRHRDAYLELAEQLGAQMFSPRQSAVLDAFDADSANLTNAIEWAAATEPGIALRLCVAQSDRWLLRGMLTQGDTAYQRALTAAEGSPSALRARVTAARALSLVQLGAVEPATKLAHAAFDAAQAADDPSVMARALYALANGSLHFNPNVAVPLAERGAELAHEAADGWAWRLNMWAIGWAHVAREEGTQAQRVMEQVLADAVGAHDRWMAMWAELALAVPRYALGDHRAARHLFGSALTKSRDLGELLGEVACRGYLGLIDSHSGQHAARLDELHEIRERALRAGVASTLPWLDLGIGVATASAGRLEPAREHLQALFDLPVLPVHIRAWSAIELAEIHRLNGDAEPAAIHAEKALELAAALPNPWFQARAQITIGRLAAARDEWREADVLHHTALDAIEDGSFLLELPTVLEALAHVAAGLESLTESARLLGAASRTRNELGFVAWPQQRDELEALRANVSETLGEDAFQAAFGKGAELAPDDAVAWVRRARGSRKRPAGGWESLTPTELDVARHAAEGLTNAEVGARMFISPGTVKVHLSHIYAKLSVRNRAQLTRQTDRHPDAESPGVRP